MALFGAKRTRTSNFKTTESWKERLDRIFSNESFLLRLLAMVVAILVLSVTVEAWRAPFTYRLGETVPQGILSRIDFERVDSFETRQEQEERAQKVPLYYLRKPNALQQTLQQFTLDLRAILEAEKQADLTSEVQSAFGLDITDTPVALPENTEGLVPEAGTSTTPPAAKVETKFQQLKQALTLAPDPELAASAGQPPLVVLEEVTEEFRLFLDPLTELGIVNADELKVLTPNYSREVALVTPLSSEEEEEVEIVPAQDVLLSYALRESGRLGRKWSSFGQLSQIRPYVEHWLSVQMKPTLTYSEQLTQQQMNEARKSTPEVTIKYLAGTVLLPPRSEIDAVTLELLQSEQETIYKYSSPQRKLVRFFTVTLLISVLVILMGSFLAKNYPRLVGSAGKLSVFLTVIVLTIFLARYFSADPWRAEYIPFLVAVMILCIVYDQMLATIVSFAVALIIVVSTTNDLKQFILLMSVAATAIIPLSKVPSRLTLIKVGFLAAVVAFIVYWGIAILGSDSITQLFFNPNRYLQSLKCSAWCLVAGYVVAGSLPFIESTFGVVTNISLLEMSDPSHPLLNELVRRAPGTYNHSINVASIGETAAEQIGANGLLVRVGAYFHDIGKMLKPEYFIENMNAGQTSRHDNLSPSMSTLIIIGHVKDGVDLARKHHLPPQLIDFIEQHHGTTLVEYFYHRAKENAEQDPEQDEEVSESSFRYPGPRPQSREAGVMMLADSVESASRSLTDPTPKRIESLVDAITMKKLKDGQFNSSGLTLTEINKIQTSLTKSLIGIYHGRIKYPETKAD
ncbi:phosphodiesterase [Polystyrenella longa]|uniref:Phosphodiesterase n=1 Tax=Polystyrenella longa TaxID=2528007 RepID=A0A518CQ37_9PLAN|nr:HDIG domain-containing metalloprotein [Polystyrenella longa]QDU81341.1 phosphodiesterase [Polystyrenella longa]